MNRLINGLSRLVRPALSPCIPAVSAALLFFVAGGIASPAFAGELRVLDGMGLVRASKVIKDKARISISVQAAGGAQSMIGQSCTLSNLDGVAKEQQATVSPQGVCEFREIPSGAWEVGVPSGQESGQSSGVRWSVTIHE